MKLYEKKRELLLKSAQPVSNPGRLSGFEVQ